MLIYLSLRFCAADVIIAVSEERQRAMVNMVEKSNVLYKLELKHGGTSDKISFMENGILIPFFLSNYVFGRKKNFFQNEKVIKQTRNGYFLEYGRDFEVMVEKNVKKQMYSVSLKSTIKTTLLIKLWRGNNPYIILTLKNLQYESVVNIYDLFEKVPNIDKISLNDVERFAKENYEYHNYGKPFVYFAMLGVLFSMNSLILMEFGRYFSISVEIFLWIFNPVFTIINTVGMVVFDHKKKINPSFLKKVKRSHIVSISVFLLVNLPTYIFIFTR